MGLSLKRLGKKLGKGLKKVAKIAAPLVVGGLTGGTGLAAYAGKALGAKALSRAKSFGIHPKSLAMKAPDVQPVSVRAITEKVTQGPAGTISSPFGGRRAPKRPAVTRSPRKARSTPAESPWLAVYRQWKAEGSPGDWESYAAQYL